MFLSEKTASQIVDEAFDMLIDADFPVDRDETGTTWEDIDDMIAFLFPELDMIDLD
jgi:hypothetical protein